MKIGIIRERKNPPDRRVVLSPKKCRELLDQFPQLEIFVEPSPIRAFEDKAYADLGIPVADNMNDCDVLLGVKEVPVEDLIPNKKYFFFSHTIKKQSYNRKLLQAILSKNIELFDHEVITNQKDIRLVAFGRYAGIVGAYNGIRSYGLKSQTYTIPKANELNDQQALIRELSKINMPNIKVVLTGKGRVGNGAREMLVGMNMKEVRVDEFLQHSFDEAVFVQIDVLDYNQRNDGQQLDMFDFFKHPQDYHSTFMKFAKVADLFIAGHFYGTGAPYLFTRNDAKDPEFNLSVVADISCDIDGPVASTLRASTIAEPNYGYDPQAESETDFMNSNAIGVMAVDNLPAELPKDASDGFGESFGAFVIPAFFNNDKESILQRARMTQDGKLTERYSYLQDYVDGKE